MMMNVWDFAYDFADRLIVAKTAYRSASWSDEL
jgi:hypothetical protein